MKILVGGASGDIGIGCARILKNISFVSSVIGFDIRPEPCNEYYFDAFTCSPRADAPEFLDWLLDYIVKLDIQIYIPTSEAELLRLSGENIPVDFAKRIMILDSSIVQSCLDKSACMAVLARSGLATPVTGLADDEEPNTFPVILKPRNGRGSQKIRYVKDRASFLSLRERGDIWQKYIPQTEGEYTCGVFRSSSGDSRSIVFQRELRNGRTVSGEVFERPEIHDYVIRVAEIFHLHGSFNVQLRILDGTPMAFEINPRLSSTLVFRDLLGFRDLRWWLCDLLRRPIETYKPPTSGTRFFRGDAEFFLTAKEQHS